MCRSYNPIFCILITWYTLLSLCATSGANKVVVSVIRVPLLSVIPLQSTFHHFLIVASENSKVILDFVPMYRQMNPRGLISSLRLLVGNSQPGKVRCVFLRHDAVPEHVSKALDSVLAEWDSEINIYYHNCQHFCNFAEKKFLSIEDDERKKQEGISKTTLHTSL